MPKEKGATFCIACFKELVFVHDLYMNDQYLMFCNNPECIRFGYPTMVSTPVGEIKKHEKKEDKKS